MYSSPDKINRMYCRCRFRFNMLLTTPHRFVHSKPFSFPSLFGMHSHRLFIILLFMSLLLLSDKNTIIPHKSVLTHTHTPSLSFSPSVSLSIAIHRSTALHTHILGRYTRTLIDDKRILLLSFQYCFFLPVAVCLLFLYITLSLSPLSLSLSFSYSLVVFCWAGPLFCCCSAWFCEGNNVKDLTVSVLSWFSGVRDAKLFRTLIGVYFDVLRFGSF